jgi:hypothetical protein
MGQSIQRNRVHDVLFGKGFSPVGEGLVAGKNDRLALFVALADGLEKQASMGFLQRQITDLIDDEKLWTGEVFDFAGQAILGQTLGHAAGQIDGGGEVDAMTHVRGEDAKSNRKMCFANNGRAKKNDVAALSEETASGALSTMR